PCSTGVRTDTVQPKREPTGRTDLSDRSRLVLCNRSQELIGQACPTRRQVLRSDSACPTTGRTRLFEHRLNCRVRPVNAGSARDTYKKLSLNLRHNIGALQTTSSISVGLALGPEKMLLKVLNS
ncbi:hypothetical protein PCASD_25522, partial [Puccinia coronata f. sp. avenae]